MEKKYLPLSDVQYSYFYGRNKHTFLGGVSTHFYIEYFTGLDKNRLEKALNCVIKEQPSLRSYITSDGKQCYMDEAPYYSIKEIDISDLFEEQQENKVLELRKQYSNRMFELDNWPMFEFIVCNTGKDKDILIIDSDMMIMDGLSTEILIEGLYKYYENDSDVIQIPIEAFSDYLNDKNEKKVRNYSSDKLFWDNIIEELPTGPQFEGVKNAESYYFSTRETSISANQWGSLSKELMSERILPSVYLTTAYAKLLSRWCSQNRLTLNMTVSNRKSSNKALKEAIGDFTEVMLVDFDFSDGSSLKEKAREAQNKISQRKKHGSVASSEIIRDYTAMNGGGNSFPFQAVCTCMLFDLAGSKWDWLGERRYQISQTPQIMLDNQISLKEGKLFIHWDYLGTYFDDDKIKSMQEEYCSIITGTNTQLQKKYNSISEKYNETFREREKNTLVKLFLKQVALHPDKTAISDMSSGFTYKEIDEASDKIADYIIENYSRNEPVIVKMTRSKNAVAAAMGIIKSGGYYIPVAHNCPEKRLEYIMVQSAGSLILTDETVNEIIGSYKRSRAYDLSEPDNIAYVIYTSGSTGTPKGVVITHDAACNTILDINERMSVTCKDKIIGISSFSFDLSVYDIFGTLSSGAELKLAPSAYDMYLIKKMMYEDNITIWNTVPSIMELLINNLVDAPINRSLRTVMLSGDWIPLNLPDRVRERFPSAEVYSLGGATEASIWSIYYPIKSVKSDWNSIPYGYPLENQSIWILDNDNDICPLGVRGEICIGGRGVARGYLNDKDRTQKQFFIHESLGYLYRTGDLGLLSENGYVVFLGRKDFQVKLHGYRIELGEIESCLSQCRNVLEAVAEVKEVNGIQKLFAYVTPLPGTDNMSDSEEYIYSCEEDDVDEDTLRVFTSDGEERRIILSKDKRYNYPDMNEMYEALKNRLMSYMIPDEIIIMEQFPYTANKKINRKLLPAVVEQLHETETYEAPETPTEQMLAGMIEDIIGVEKIGVKANLINSGIDSLKGITLNTKLHDRGINIGLSEIYANPTIRQLGKLIDESDSEDMEYGEI